MDLSVIVVSLNGRDMTLDCLRSITAAAAGLEVEMILVDNGSTDGTARAVAEAMPSVRIIENGSNRGYGPAANQGMRASTGRIIALLNNDAKLPEGGLRSLAAYLEAFPECAVVGPQLIHEDGRRQHSFDTEPSLVTELLNKSVLRRVAPGAFPSRLQDRTEPLEVASLVGACFVLRRSIAEQLGFFDEEYFYLYEETDFCLRARNLGFKVMFHPGVKVIHLQGQTRKKVRVRAKIEQARSRFIYFRKHHPAQYVALRIISPIKSLLEAVLWLAATVVTVGLWGKARLRLAESAAALGWQLLLCPRGFGLSGHVPGAA